MRRDPLFSALLLANFAARLANELVRSPVLPLLVLSLGGGAAWVGLVGSMSGLVGTALRLPIGSLVDAWGAGRLLVAGGLVFALAPPLYLLAPGVGAVALVRSVHALGPALFSPSSMSLAARSDPEHAGWRVGWVDAAKALASVAGGALAGWIVGWQGPRLAFWASAACGLVALGTAWVVAERAGRRAAGRRAQAAAPARAGGLQAAVVRTALLLAWDGSLWRAALPGVWAMVLQSTAIVFLPVVGAAYRWPPVWIGALVALHHATCAVAGPLGGRLTDRAGPRASSAAALALGAAGTGALALWPSAAAALGAAVASGVAASFTGPAALIAMRRASRHPEGATIGLWSTAMDLGEAVGALGSGAVAAFLGVNETFGAWSLVSLALFAFTAATGSGRPRGPARAAPPRPGGGGAARGARTG
ncbi:MAG: MFS transporter [Clostridia bacterium]|nr:MFS transporter [Clostridia bacterium]